MSENVFYLGAYLEIKTKPIVMEETVKSCKNNHKRTSYGPFCNLCGEPILTKIITTIAYPSLVYEHILKDKQYEYSLSTFFLSNDDRGIVCAIGEKGNAGWWLYLDPYYGLPEKESFPTKGEITKMKIDLETNYSEVIESLRRSPVVISVVVKAGYLSRNT